MTRRRAVPRARRRLLIAIGLALYVIVLGVAPFEHHDLVCHLKNPQHCTSCASSQLGPDVLSPVEPGASHLSDAGSATIVDPILEGTLLVTRTSGRSPPSGV
jgi:hypothetical protein